MDGDKKVCFAKRDVEDFLELSPEM
jgi:hypothetical protein